MRVFFAVFGWLPLLFLLILLVSFSFGLVSNSFSLLFGENSLKTIYSVTLGTFVIAFGTLLVTSPFAFLLSLSISEFSPYPARRIFYSVLQATRNIPTILLAFAGLFFVIPFLDKHTALTGGQSALLAIIFLAGVSFSEIASRMTQHLMLLPTEIRTQTTALGAGTLFYIFRIVLPVFTPAFWSSVFWSTTILLGESIIVFFLAGSSPQVTFNILQEMRTINAEIVDQIRLTPADQLQSGLYTLAFLTFLFSIFTFALSRHFLSIYTRRLGKKTGGL